MNFQNKYIQLYFKVGFSNKKILLLLAHLNKLVISMSTLKRRLRFLGLFRRKKYADLLEVAVFILQQQETSGKLHGYRCMHLKCIQSGFNIPRDTDSQLMKIIDPDGVKCRLSRKLRRRQYASPGPNFAWHIDSYDKLKPYGIAINGCIDGFSRYMVWLEAGTTNSDLKVISNYFIKAVKEKAGCPQRVRSDFGTEDVYVANRQKFLRRNHNDEFAGDKSYLSGKSTHNQRIEWFWGILRKQMVQYYMDLFADLCKDGHNMFCGDFVDKSVIQFCFMDIIQSDLDDLRCTWNKHTMQKKPGNGSGKRPILLYSIPHIYNAEDHLYSTDEMEVLVCEGETTPKKMCDETVFELCTGLMTENNLMKPSNANECKKLYVTLRQILKHELAEL
ncbi:unnamed protein product [Mytilus coruscus]|uniref:Integrase core domain-containing protein n=1 Tax=Mytilus coruscus TaxID=42192 RepID=A0A6J8CIH3_MYTCO|nr:unnamed protein product [Mytilus coruscus]